VAQKRTDPAESDGTSRARILEDLDTTLLVEAAAGTGKTTSIIGRMVALLAAGKCRIDTLAAVTFTRKAASELRSRFQIELEKACRNAPSNSRDQLNRALAGIERCFIGTIHSFCGRMLRERPVEAGVAVNFQEIDDQEDREFRERAWGQYLSNLYRDGSPVLKELEALGLEIGHLAPAFMKLAGYPDVQEWPADELPRPEPSRAIEALRDYAVHMESISPTFPDDPGNDEIMPRYRTIPLRCRQALRSGELSDFMEILAQFKNLKVVKKNWPGRKQQADEEKERWDDFRTAYAEPLVKQWLEHRYRPILNALLPAVGYYDEIRARAGKLNYQDLLMRAAGLLRANPGTGIRDYYRRRFSHVLVDEFQDTDPIQAEVVMLLTADDQSETDWRKCRPRPGSLFVVGDPKQSIYRFRRADIVTYNQVKEIIVRNGGEVLTLSANFRTIAPIITWVNDTFGEEFGKYSPDCSPAYVPLEPVREDKVGAELTGVRTVRIPVEMQTKEPVREHDAGLIAGTIRRAIDGGLAIPRTVKESEAGIGPEVSPGDFLVVAPKKANLAIYSRKLQELGIAHQVTGGSAMNQVSELGLLLTCLRALARPDDPVALVAVLRGELFGISDPALFHYKSSGGNYSFYEGVPDGLDDEERWFFQEAFDRLRKYSLWLAGMPAVAAVERIAADLGLPARAAARPGGDVQAGSLAKAIELLRSHGPETYTLAQIVDCFAGILKEEDHDAIPARPLQSSAVRVMNLHKVKGLEAPVVFLADPTGENSLTTDFHVDRSGDRVKGYVLISGPSLGSASSRTVLARPPNWDEISRKEREFQEAERLRLLYVAATRAGCGLAVSQRGSKNGLNPWKFFEKPLEGSPELPWPAAQKELKVQTLEIGEEEVSRAEELMRKRWLAAAGKSYDVVAVKALTVPKGKFLLSKGEHGVEWGTVIHLLLEAAMQDPRADLRVLAQNALNDQGMNSALTGEALETVAAVMASDLWRRAGASTQRLVEVPFQRFVDSGPEDELAGTLLRGVIDLAFREKDGWVIVDYKSDRVPECRLSELADIYASQVASYADAWGEMTGQTVTEKGLYFTHPRKYVQV